MGTWERIVRAQRRILFILLVHLLPLLILAGAAEGFQLVHWGYKDKFGAVTPLNQADVLRFEAAQAGALLIMLLGAALAVKAMAETFHARTTFTQALTVVAYGIGPVLAIRIFLLIPGLQPSMRWIPFVAGILLSLAVLYHGVPRVMALDPTNAFGLYVTTVLVMVLATGAVYLSGFLFLDRNRSLLTG